LSRVLRPRLVQVGYLKIGRKDDEIRKSAGGREWQKPERLDHMLITTLERDSTNNLKPDAPLMESLISEFGSVTKTDKVPKLRQLPIALLSDDPEDLLQSKYEYYQKGRCLARCDSETLTVYRTKDGEALPKPIIKPCTGEHLAPEAEQRPELPPKPAEGWKLHSKLSFVIAHKLARWGGVYEHRTTSPYSAGQIYGGLLETARLNFGVLEGIPLWLVMRPIQVAPPGIPPTEVYWLHVEMRGVGLEELQTRTMQRLEARKGSIRAVRLLQAEVRGMLTAHVETEDEEREIAEEFHPEGKETIDPRTGEVTYEMTKTAPVVPPAIAAAVGPPPPFASQAPAPANPPAVAPLPPVVPVASAPPAVPPQTPPANPPPVAAAATTTQPAPVLPVAAPPANSPATPPPPPSRAPAAGREAEIEAAFQEALILTTDGDSLARTKEIVLGAKGKVSDAIYETMRDRYYEARERVTGERPPDTHTPKAKRGKKPPPVAVPDPAPPASPAIAAPPLSSPSEPASAAQSPTPSAATPAPTNTAPPALPETPPEPANPPAVAPSPAADPAPSSATAPPEHLPAAAPAPNDLDGLTL
jgi:hypothetical protein